MKNTLLLVLFLLTLTTQAQQETTDLGKKLATKQVLLAQKAMLFGQTWGMEVSQIAQKYN